MIHVLTPFSRWWNLIELGDHLKKQGVHWHLLLDGGVCLPDLGSWVRRHWFSPPPKDFFIGHWMINEFLDHTEVVDDDLYHVLTDDDFTQEGFYDGVRQIEGDIIITSMYRSNKPSGTNSDCAFGTLIAAPENIGVGRVGLEQMLIRGSMLKNYRLTGEYHADGLLIEKLWAEHPGKFVFAPDLFVHFNKLPPGRLGRWDR